MLPFLSKPNMMVNLCRTNVHFLALMMQYIIANRGNVPWSLKYETYVHGHFKSLRGMRYLQLRFQTYKFLPQVMSRACRGCGKRTDRRVSATPICEKCTKNTKRKWSMVPTCRIPLRWYRGVPIHSGRRSHLVFVPDVIKAGRVSKQELLMFIKRRST